MHDVEATCSRCFEKKPAESFPRDRSSSIGRYRYCKPCKRDYEALRTGREVIPRFSCVSCGGMFSRSLMSKKKPEQCKRCRTAEWDRRTPEEKIGARRLSYRESARRRVMEKTYGITEADYQQRLTEQDGRCGICGSKDPGGTSRSGRLFIDHDKETGRVRGLLCSPCNLGIGQFRHRGHLLRAAVAYLTSH